MARRTIEYLSGSRTLQIRHNRLLLNIVVPDYYGRVMVQHLGPVYARSEYNQTLLTGEIRYYAYKITLDAKQLKWLSSRQVREAIAYSLKWNRVTEGTTLDVWRKEGV